MTTKIIAVTLGKKELADIFRHGFAKYKATQRYIKVSTEIYPDLKSCKTWIPFNEENLGRLQNTKYFIGVFEIDFDEINKLVVNGR